SAQPCHSPSRHGRCLTSWHGWFSPNSSTAPAPSCGESPITNDAQVSGPIVVTETLGGSSLSRAARRGETPSWYRGVPVGREAWRAYTREVATSAPRNWFEDLRPAMNPGGAAAARLERVAGGDGVIITTGQQPGLFGGPLMTLVKALSARALADALEAEIQRPVATVFWAATDDADFDEAAVVSIAGESGAEELKME